MELEGRTALVTGAAHRVGRAIALGLGRSGCHVAVHYGRSEEAALETVGKLREMGSEAWAVAADLRRPEEIDRLFREVETRWAGLDVLVNSAAGFEFGPLMSLEPTDWDRVLALNLRAPFLCLQGAARLMASGDRWQAGVPACVINIADLSGLEPWPGYAHHGVSKAGLLHLTRVAARELGPGIRVNAVVPGAVLPPPGLDPDDPAWRRMGERLPVAGVGHPARVAEAVAFLAKNDFITGETLRVDGGEHLLGSSHRRLSEPS
jgi:pteridine reductase